MAEFHEDEAGVAAIQYASARYARKVAEEVEQDMVDLCPVDTGRLQRSIRVEQVGDSVYVFVGGDNAFYWQFVEFGTRYMRAQPFIRPALNRRHDVVLGDEML